MDYWNRPFIFSSLCHEDLRQYLSDEEIATLTDGDTEAIADKMSDAHRDAGGYWEAMEITARSVLTTPLDKFQQQC